MKDQNSNNEEQSEVVVLMVPLPAQGHLNQLLHLSHLITSYDITVHYATSSAHNHQAKHRLHGWNSQMLSKLHFHDLELPPYDSPLPQVDPFEPYPNHLIPLFDACMLLRNPVFRIIQELSDKFRRVIVIHDILMTFVVQDVKIIPNAKAYTLIPTCAFFYFLEFWEELSDSEKPFQLDSNDIPQGIPTLEGCVPLSVMELFSKQQECLEFESGWIFNTSRVIDGKYVEFIDKLFSPKRDLKLFALGPFHPIDINKSEESAKNKHHCLEWLEQQEKNSVIFVSFGSTVSLSDEQIEELANGLEKSGEKFVWVLRGADPNDIFKEGDRVRRPQLPKGYEERVKDRGIIVRDWAPQLEILAHSSVCGFMSHCGWNSCIESISMGVPIAAWPVHSDQPRNAALVCQVLRIGVLVRDWENRRELVRESAIENAVKKVMASKEGKEMQERAKELGEAVRGSVAKGGVTCLERDSFIAHISK